MSSEAVETVEAEGKEEEPSEPPKEVPETAEQQEKKEGEEAGGGDEGAAPEGGEGEGATEGAGEGTGEEGAEGEGAEGEGAAPEGEGEEGLGVTPSGAVAEGIPEEGISVSEFSELQKEESVSSSVKYGGCEGQNAMYLRLMTNDKHEFIVRRDYAMISSTIKAILGRPSDSEEVADTVEFRNITSHIMCIVCEYFNYRAYYSKTAPPFPPFEVPTELALTMLMTANMLQI